MSAGTDHQRLEQLDVLRGLAALGVALFHLPGFFRVPDLLPFGFLFVDLFFLLSGFVLTPIVARQRRRGEAAWHFLAARVRRFWGVAAVGTMLGAVAFSTNPEFTLIWPKLALGLAFLPALAIGGALFPLNVVQWSLFWELVANWAHAAWGDSAGDRALIGTVAASGALYAYGVWSQGSADLGSHDYNGLYAAPRVAFSYGAGMLMARRAHPVTRAGLTRGGVLLALVLVAVALVPLAGPHRLLAATALVLAGFPLLFWQLVHASSARRYPPVLRLLGRLSFPFYAVHMPVLLLVKAVTLSAWGAIVGLPLALAVSYWIARMFEPAPASRAPLPATVA